jgi:type IV pilus assembly protein PilW
LSLSIDLHKMNKQPSFKVQRFHLMVGLGLIEIMISMVLGIFLVGGVITLFTSNQQNFKVNENLAQIQEGARFAYEQMNREVRDAGTNPCGVRAVNSVVRSPTPATTPWWGDWNGGTVRGFDGNEEITSAGVAIGTSVNNRVTGTDAIVIMRPQNDDSALRTVALHDISTNKFTLNTSAKIQKLDLLFVCDNLSGAVFEVATPAGPAAATNITYDLSAPTSNCSDRLGWAANVSCATNSVTKTFTVGSIITKFDPGIWYIGVSSTNSRRSLYRESIHNNGTNITTERREFVPDVYDMQIKYLTRTNPASTATTASVLATDWVDASTINAMAGAWSSTNLTEAVAVRIELTFRSKESVGTDGTINKPIERKTISVISLRSRELKP